VNNRAMNHALEPCCRLRLALPVYNQPVKLTVDIGKQLLAQQVEVNITGTHDRRRILIVNQRDKQMLQRRIFVAAFIGVLKSPVKRFFKTGRK
jgi:hypothetical protein